MIFFPDIEKQSAQAIIDFQNRELIKAINYANKYSPFYKKHFALNGIDSKDIRNLEALRTIPPTAKDDLQKFNMDFLCVPRNKIIEYTSTSGTLGKPVTIALTENDLQRLAYNEAISFACAGLGSDDIFQLMLTMDRQFMAGIAYHEGIRRLGAGIVRIGPGLPALQWQTVLDLKPTVLIGVPSFIVKLLEYADQAGIDYKKSSVKTVICIGENIRTAELQLNALGKRIKQSWNITLISTYASTEMQTAFSECSHGKGGHHHPELVIIELLNDQNLPVEQGDAGEVTITTLGVEGMPLIRYKTGDMARLFTAPCACGRTTFRISPILGRKQQMIKLKGTTFYPQAVFEIMNKARLVKDYVVELTANGNGLDELKILVSTDFEDEVRHALPEDFKSDLRTMPIIQFMPLESLQKIQTQSGSRKILKFIDKR